MIPKRIHYCWFGGAPYSDLMRKCMESWRTVLTGYTIQRWDEKNSPMRFPYLQRALQHGKWANMSNLVRLYALFAEGGIYLDTDVEVVKSFDDLLHLPGFLGCESDLPKVNNAVYGSEAGHPFLHKTLTELLQSFDGTERANESSPELTTRLLTREGLTSCREAAVTVSDVVIFPTRYFYPFHFKEAFTPQCVTPDTYTIHHWQKSWQ